MKNAKKRVDLIIAAATARELPFSGIKAAAGLSISEIAVGGLRVLLLATGPGPVNAAFALGGALAIYETQIVVGTGIGGAFAQSGLAPGDLAVASVECDADTGIEPPSPDLPPAPLSIPVSTGEFGRFPTDSGLTEQLFAAAKEVGKAALGPFVTSATVTASLSRANRLNALYGAVCENMEGAALALAAQRAGAAFVELRGVSNPVGPRDFAAWKIDEAIHASTRGVELFVEILAGARP